VELAPHLESDTEAIVTAHNVPCFCVADYTRNIRHNVAMQHVAYCVPKAVLLKRTVL
jgi:hypothetical protein